MSKKKSFIYISNKKYDGMMGRCYRPKDGSYKNYGERGIRVCSAWIKDIDVFRCWLKAELIRLNIEEEEFCQNPKQYQLDRINTDGHYTPDNCRLASPQCNGRNRRTTARRVIISAEGEEISL
jgi:hypothetical protein